MAKFKVIYTPDGGSKREWVLDLANPAWDVMSQTERITNWPWEEFGERLSKQSALALQALLWVLRKREEPRLQLDSVTVDFAELAFEATCPECDEWVSDDEHVCMVDAARTTPAAEDEGQGEA